MKKSLIFISIMFMFLTFSYITLDALARMEWLGNSPYKVFQRAKLSGIKNKNQCLSHYWDSYKECSGKFCDYKSITYVAICLRGSRGDKEAFCKGRGHSYFNQEYIDLNQKVGLCRLLGIDDDRCLKMNKPLRSYCEY